MIRTVTTVRELKAAMTPWHGRDGTVGFVPTMGALHEGHLSLVRRAQDVTQHTVVSVFVNPLQFGPGEDLEHYPRNLESDQCMLEAAGCDLLFAPTTEEIYPPGFATRIDPGPLATILEGKFRPGHFVGVATVVTRLLMQVGPDYAFFGEKDYQQLLIIQQTVRDLSIPVTILPAPIGRAADGLALSSRNAYLPPSERAKASHLPATLFGLVERLRAGEDVEPVLLDGQRQLVKEGFRVDYLTLVDERTLEPLTLAQRHARLLVAVHLGATRLIDNMPIARP